MGDSPAKENDVVVIDSVKFDEEEITDSFVCCVCLDLMYKPIVLDCGHISCFWCVHKSMNLLCESTCPVCRNSYHHFPTVCWIFHFLIVKMYPNAYRRREKEILEEEERRETFSPDFDGNFSELNYLIKSNSSSASAPLSISSSPLSPSLDSNSSCEGTKFEEQRPGVSDHSVGTAIKSSTSTDETSQSISIKDVLCPACKQLLFRPAVLNCGHAYCESCIDSGDDDIIICQVCGTPHPSDPPKACPQISNFLEETFPKEYADKRETVQCRNIQTQQRPPSGKPGFKSSVGNGELPSESSGHEIEVHPGVGCDTCGMYPIVGPRYRCKDCKEKIGFDVCGECYNTKSKLPGRFNQRHTSEHCFERLSSPLTTEHVKNQNLMWSIMQATMHVVGSPHSDHEEESDDERDRDLI